MYILIRFPAGNPPAGNPSQGGGGGGSGQNFPEEEDDLYS